MTLALPRIAIPEPTSTDEAYNQRSLPQYIRAIEAAGGTAVPISLQDSPSVQADILASCSAVLLPGSPADLDPARYGQETRERICAEGCAAGGSRRPPFAACLRAWETGLRNLLWPAVPKCMAARLAHPAPAPDGTLSRLTTSPGGRCRRLTPIEVMPGSRLAAIAPRIQEEEGSFVNSSHHQAIDRPGQKLIVAAVSPEDGVIEALEGAEPDQFVVAVQWHPERSYESSAASRALFAAFLEAARSWSSTVSPTPPAGRLGAH